jgi:vacuolar-type H+-ATPase subunit H
MEETAAAFLRRKRIIHEINDAEICVDAHVEAMKPEPTAALSAATQRGEVDNG